MSLLTFSGQQSGLAFVASESGCHPELDEGFNGSCYTEDLSARSPVFSDSRRNGFNETTMRRDAVIPRNEGSRRGLVLGQTVLEKALLVMLTYISIFP